MDTTIKQRKRTVYGYKTRLDDNSQWSETGWFKRKAERDRAASYSRIIGGFRTNSFEEKKTLEEIEELNID